MKQIILENLAWGIFYSFFVILAVWGYFMLKARDERWAEEAKLKKEQEASQA